MSKLIVGNWKMNGQRADIAPYLAILQAATLPAATTVICPPFPYLAAFADSPFALGGQNCHAQPQGAFTGSVSAAMLKDCGCSYVIIGHSDRRRDFAEDNSLLQAKLQAALAAGLTPIFCVGELDGEDAETVLAHQLQALAGLPIDRIVIAYEPVWAISTGIGKVAGPETIAPRHAFIRQQTGVARILYGGSAKADNAAALLAIAGVDGLLVGGASLDARQFAAIAKAA